MAKTRLTAQRRKIIECFMAEAYDEKHKDRPSLHLFGKIVDAVGKMLRELYPEDDMVVLRKHNCAVKRDWYHFIGESGRMRTFYFRGGDSPADCPMYHDDNLRMSAQLEALIDEFDKANESEQQERTETVSEYRSWLFAQKTVEDVLETIPLPQSVLNRLGAQSTALTIVSPELVGRIKADFAEAK